jgi:hypothetical protein
MTHQVIKVPLPTKNEIQTNPQTVENLSRLQETIPSKPYPTTAGEL